MHRVIRTALLIATLALPTLAAASSWDIDPAHASANFAVKHMMVSTVRGTMGKVTGTMTLDDSDITRSSIEATIDVKGIDTREAKRDDHLRGPDFFDVATYPTITFKSKKVEKVSDTTYKVTGDLTIHGITKETILDVEGSPTPLNDPFGNVKLGGTATTTINRKDFGMAWSKTLDSGGLLVGNDVAVTVDVEVTKRK